MLKKGTVTNCRNDTLLDFYRIHENDTNIAIFSPLTLALIVAKFNSQFLLAFNRFRNNWEIPGGHIDRGETPRQSAIRELREETGQLAKNPRFEGIMKFHLHPDNRIEYGALFSVQLNDLLDFKENSEISKWSYGIPVRILERLMK